MEEIKIQLKYMMDLIDEDFKFTKSGGWWQDYILYIWWTKNSQLQN